MPAEQEREQPEQLDAKGRYVLSDAGPTQIDLPRGQTFSFQKAVGPGSSLKAGIKVYWDPVTKHATAEAAGHTKLGTVVRDADDSDMMVILGCWTWGEDQVLDNPTVGQMIESLRGFPPEAKIVLDDADTNWKFTKLYIEWCTGDHVELSGSYSDLEEK